MKTSVKIYRIDKKLTNQIKGYLLQHSLKNRINLWSEIKSIYKIHKARFKLWKNLKCRLLISIHKLVYNRQVKTKILILQEL